MRAVLIILLIGLFTGNFYSQDLDSNTVVFSVLEVFIKKRFNWSYLLWEKRYIIQPMEKNHQVVRKDIQDTINLDKTTPIRAVAYKNGKPGKIVTHTYLIGREYNMAVISITGNPDDFFSFDRGIYVKGCCADSLPPYKRANFWKGWERRINIEFYEPTGELGFQSESRS